MGSAQVSAKWLHPGAFSDGFVNKADEEGLRDLSYWPLELRFSNHGGMGSFVYAHTRTMIDDQNTLESCVRQKFMEASLGRVDEREEMMELAMDLCEYEMVEAMRARSHAMRGSAIEGIHVCQCDLSTSTSDTLGHEPTVGSTLEDGSYYHGFWVSKAATKCM